MPSNRSACKRMKYCFIPSIFCLPTFLGCSAFNLYWEKPFLVLFLYWWQWPECHLMQAWWFSEGNRREKGGRVRRIRMYFRSEASGALLQLVFQGRREFKGGMWRRAGGRGGRLSQQTVARKHLWHLFSLLVEMPELTDREAAVKCQSYPPRSLKNVPRVSI